MWTHLSLWTWGQPSACHVAYSVWIFIYYSDRITLHQCYSVWIIHEYSDWICHVTRFLLSWRSQWKMSSYFNFPLSLSLSLSIYIYIYIYGDLFVNSKKSINRVNQSTSLIFEINGWDERWLWCIFIFDFLNK